MAKYPLTLVEAISLYADEHEAFEQFCAMRWPDGTTCPHCGGKEQIFISTRCLWRCKQCRKQFSAKVGTIFEDSPIRLGTWLTAIWLICNAKNGISSHEISRTLGITQKTAWFMLHRIRVAMTTGSFNKLDGEVEIDETFVGGKRSNMHKDKKAATGGNKRGMYGKATVLGMLERGGNVVAQVVDNTKKHTLCAHVEMRVEPGATVYTDALSSYDELQGMYNRKVIDHKVAYVDGATHVNGIENFWALFKRCLKGTYIHVDEGHLNSYVDEQVFRFNARKTNDRERFMVAVGQVDGRRLSYQQLKARKHNA